MTYFQAEYLVCFCGVEYSNQAPYGDTLGRFRNLLIRNELQEKLFAQVV